MEYSRAAFAQMFLRAAQDAAAAAASARGHREQEAILLLSVSYSALWAECRFSVLQNAQVPGMGRTKQSKNQKTSQKQPSAAGFGQSGGHLIPIWTDGGLALLLPGSPGQMGGQSHAAAVFCLYFAPALTNSTNDKPNSHSVSLVPASLDDMCGGRDQEVSQLCEARNTTMLEKAVLKTSIWL